MSENEIQEYEVLSPHVGDDGLPHYVGEHVTMKTRDGEHLVKRGWLKPVPPPAAPVLAFEPEPEGDADPGAGDGDPEAETDGEQAPDTEVAAPSGGRRRRNQ